MKAGSAVRGRETLFTIRGVVCCGPLRERGKPMKRSIAAVVAISAAAMIAAASGGASPRQPLTINCRGLGDIQVLTAPAYGAEQSWGAAQVVGDGHLIPVQFQFSLLDVTTQQMLFADLVTKSGAHGGGLNKQTISCGFVQTGTLGDFVPPDELGTLNPNDQAIFAIQVEVIPK
jgi:hypothetical protein